MPNLLHCIGRAVAAQGVGDILAAVAEPNVASAANLMAKIAAGVWKEWREDKQQEQLKAEIAAAAKLSFEEARQEAAEIARQVTADPELQGHVERFVTLVPACIRASLRRPDDPTGTIVPLQYAVEDASDVITLLPARFPRPQLRPGYAPPFLRGWELTEQLGVGGFGEVWKVRNQRADQLVAAVKFGHALDDTELALLNEHDVLNRLLAHGRHPGIVELHDVWATGDDIPWLRYEFVPGGDLAGLIRQWAALPTAERLPLALPRFRELCETVAHFHALTPAIVHRDLKPSNVLVAADGRLKVGDFGIGSVSAHRALDGERQGALSRTNTVQAYLRGAHTPLYAPPEQKADPKHRPAPTDDVHALGVILYQMLTGRLDAAPAARFEKDLDGVPRPVIDLLGSCVDVDRTRRPADAPTILAAMERIKAFKAGRSKRTPATPPAAKKLVAWDWSWLGVALPLLVSFLVCAGADLWKASTNPTPVEPAPSPWILAAGTRPGDEVTLPIGTSGKAITFCWIPPGEFDRGTPDGPTDEQPVRRVKIGHGFWMAKTETTVEQWRAAGLPYETGWFDPADLPAGRITWDNAAKFADKLKGLSGKPVRLPTEAEWEYACRAGTTTAYHSGDTESDLKLVGWHGDGPNGKNRRVGQLHANAWGLYDMHGNVMEWCSDWYDEGFYARGPEADPECTQDGGSGQRVLRGGSWFHDAAGCRSAYRRTAAPTAYHANYGFRVCFTPTK